MMPEPPLPFFNQPPTNDPTSVKLCKVLAQAGASFEFDYTRLSLATFKDDITSAQQHPDPEMLNVALTLHLIDIMAAIAPMIDELRASDAESDRRMVAEYEVIAAELGACNTCFTCAQWEEVAGRGKYNITCTISTKDNKDQSPKLSNLRHEGKDVEFETSAADLREGTHQMLDAAFRRLNCGTFHLVFRAKTLAHRCGFLNPDEDIVNVNAPSYDRQATKEVLRKHGRGDS